MQIPPFIERKVVILSSPSADGNAVAQLLDVRWLRGEFIIS
jgi:hypothetical protein